MCSRQCLFPVSLSLFDYPTLSPILGPSYCRRYYRTNGRSSTSTHWLKLQCDRRNPWPESLTRELAREKEETRGSCSDAIASLYFVNWIRSSSFRVWQTQARQNVSYAWFDPLENDYHCFFSFNCVTKATSNSNRNKFFLNQYKD